MNIQSEKPYPIYTLLEIADLLDAELRISNDVDKDVRIEGLASLASATENRVSFLANVKYRAELSLTRAAAVILSAEDAEYSPVACLIHEEPYLAYAKLSHYFNPRPKPILGIHPSAVIAENVKIGDNVSIGPGVVILDQVLIGDNVVISSNSVIENAVVIGDNVTLMPNVVLNFGVKLGCGVVIQSGTVIGSDGFGYAPSGSPKGSNAWQKIAHCGSVVIGDRVEIGANTTIDRGVLDDTSIADDVIIDNQVHIAHNVKIGAGTAIAGCTGIAGSTTIGKDCRIAGGVGIIGHINIADRVSILSMTRVTRSISQAGTFASGTSMQAVTKWRKSAARLNQLDDLHKRVKALENKKSL
ncbi:MAG: UDP-3-O-(3-hydroxymyristoyl)glucosamine N-acyltransferase [Cellvibrionales bacterium]|nr:UDP-3-O-(3-hydroxymyristoyl)glucosamine N-acyltransferase [Cellvibrionales bacterium]